MYPNAKKKQQQEMFEKSFNESLDELSKLLDGDTDAMQKAMKGSSKKAAAPSGESSQSQEEEMSGSSEVEEKRSPIKKSVEDAIDDDPEASVAVDVEPFLKAMVQAIDARLDGMERNFGKALKQVGIRIQQTEVITKAMGNTMRNAFEMSKSIKDEVEKIGNAPVQSTSVLRKSGDRFPEADGKDAAVEAVAKMPKQEVLNKALELRMKGQMDPMDVTLIEGRLNKGLPLDPRHAGILAKSMSN